MTKDDIPTTSRNKKHSNLFKTHFKFNKVSDREVYEILLKLDSNKGPGTDNLDTKSLKSISHVISEHLASLFNQ